MRRLSLICVIAALAVPVGGQSADRLVPGRVIGGFVHVISDDPDLAFSAMADVVTYESLTIDATAGGVAFAAATLDPPGRGQTTACRGRLETGQVRYRFDGTGPTATEGLLLEIGETITVGNHADAQRIRFIRTGGTSGTLKAHCWIGPL